MNIKAENINITLEKSSAVFPYCFFQIFPVAEKYGLKCSILADKIYFNIVFKIVYLK